MIGTILAAVISGLVGAAIGTNLARRTPKIPTQENEWRDDPLLKQRNPYQDSNFGKPLYTI